jgi:O-acetyl-ADP-ribose deacetylase (regulator of RNase III)
LAIDHNCRSIAFPLISSGIYGYPKEQALQVATNTTHHELDVYIALFGDSETLYPTIK